MSSANVARAMEETISLMQSAKKARLLDSKELTDVTRRRRDFEYRLLAKSAPRSAFLSYAAFERDLAKLLKSRAKAKGIKKARTKLLVKHTAGRANLVYSRAVRRFKGDSQLWLHYARHLIEYGSHRSACKVFGQALAVRPNDKDVWMAAIAFYADTLGNSGAARKLSMRALRSVAENDLKPIYATYFRFELAFLCKSIARRVAMRLPIPETEMEAKCAEDENVDSETKMEVEDTANSGDEDAAPLLNNDNDGSIMEVVELDGDKVGSDDEGNDADDDVVVVEEEETKSAKKRVRTLKYWQGGAPLIVLKEVTEKVKLSVEEFVNDYWKVVIQMPHTPWQLIESTEQQIAQSEDSDEKEQALPYQLITATLPFDSALAKLNNTAAPEPEAEEDSTQHTTAHKAATAQVEKAVGKAHSALVQILQGMRAEDPVVTSIVQVFFKRAKPYLSEEQIEELHEEMNDVRRRQSKDEEAAQNVTLSQVLEAGTADAWERYLVRAKTFKAGMISRVRNAVMKFILVPFRSDEKDQVAALWVEWEDDWEKLIEGLDKLMALPPLSERVLRATLKALKVRLDGDERKRCIAMLRRVYDKLTCLPKAQRDVDLWIEYTEFERDTCMDSTKCNTVVWKAKKALPSNSAELFDEKLSIRLLKR